MQEAEIRRIVVQSYPWQIVLQDATLKNPFKNRAGGVAQDVSPEFKPQYCQKEKKKTQKTIYTYLYTAVSHEALIATSATFYKPGSIVRRGGLEQPGTGSVSVTQVNTGCFHDKGLEPQLGPGSPRRLVGNRNL
jgi:hypothetical protein